MDVWLQMANGKLIPSIVATKDKHLHAQLKRPVAGLYSNTNVMAYEPRVHDTIRYFIQRLDEEYIRGDKAGTRCPIDNWVQWCKSFVQKC